MPPDSTPEFIAELEQRGFARIETVTVKALEPHTYHGQDYDAGETYACDDQDVEAVEVQGKAVRVSGKPAYKTTAVDERRTTHLSTPPKK